MRKIVLGVAVSLDGHIEGPNGEYDWCFTDQDYGMREFFKRFDTLFLGRKTFEMAGGNSDTPKKGDPFAKWNRYVFSTTLTDTGKSYALIKENVKEHVEQIKQQPGKDIWLFGGAGLLTSLLNLDLVDELSLAVHPIILGQGKPLFRNIDDRVNLTLTDTKSYSTGLVSLVYDIKHK